MIKPRTRKKEMTQMNSKTLQLKTVTLVQEHKAEMDKMEEKLDEVLEKMEQNNENNN